MKRTSHLWIASALLITAPTLRGRLSETPAQIEQRLGPPVETRIKEGPFGDMVGNCTFKAYSKNGVRCEVYFLRGASVAEFYRKEDAAFFEDGELQSILDVNNSGSTWGKASGVRPSRYWSRADGGATASYQEANNRDVLQTELSIYTPAFDAEHDRSEKAKASKRLDGF